MKRSTTIGLYYGAVAVVSAAILGLAFWVRSGLPEPELPVVRHAGKEDPGDWFPIERDLKAMNQNGQEVRLSDLKGKVWLVAQFFAVCPHCAVRNGEELDAIRKEFGGDPDFHIVCVTVDPANDGLERLRSYAEALGADSENWWFLNAGGQRETHEYLEKVLKFFAARERTNPHDIEANGRFAHDLGLLLVNRDFEVVGKWPLADARSEKERARNPELYGQLKADLYSTIRKELDSPRP